MNRSGEDDPLGGPNGGWQRVVHRGYDTSPARQGRVPIPGQRRCGQPAHRTRPVGRPASRIAFGVWSTAFAIGVLIHEWQAVQPPWTPHTLAGLVAIVVLLRPWAVWRTALLGAVLAAELATSLPQPYNHALLASVAGGAVAVWWALLRLRSPSAARDPGVVFDRVAPFLRVGLLLTLFAHGIALLNTGFLDAVSSCAAGIIDTIWLLSVPRAGMPVMIVVSVLVELGIPALLLFHRTRPWGVALGMAYYLLLTAGGDPSMAGLGWAMMLLFVPAPTLARAAALVAGVLRDLPRPSRGLPAGEPARFAVLGGLWVAASVAFLVPPDWVASTVTRWTSMIVGMVWLGLWVAVLFRLRTGWTRPSSPRIHLGVSPLVLLAALGLLVLDVASPYLGLKTRYSVTMYTNLRTEGDQWNHLLIPEQVRVFGAQDELVRLISSTDPEVQEALDDEIDGDAQVLLDARRFLADAPRATVVYEYRGETHTAAPVAADPVLGVQPSWLQAWLGGFRTIPTDGRCRH